MYFVGIDISKFKHDCAIVDELGDVITPSWSFPNDCEGFSLLKELLDALNGERKIGLVLYRHQILGDHESVDRIRLCFSERFAANKSVDQKRIELHEREAVVFEEQL